MMCHGLSYEDPGILLTRRNTFSTPLVALDPEFIRPRNWKWGAHQLPTQEIRRRFWSFGISCSSTPAGGWEENSGETAAAIVLSWHLVQGRNMLSWMLLEIAILGERFLLSSQLGLLSWPWMDIQRQNLQTWRVGVSLNRDWLMEELFQMCSSWVCLRKSSECL